MQDAAQLGRLLAGTHFLRVAALYVDAQLFFQYVDFLVECQFFPAEYPGTAEGGAPYHHSIHPIGVEGSVGIRQRLDVAIADDGDVDARIPLHLTDECPVGVARVHLCSCASVDGQRLYAAVLQLFCQFGDNQLFGIPTQSRLYRDGQMDGIHHLACDFQHLGDILQHTCTSPFASHLLHGASEVQVYHVGTCLFHDSCSLHHCVHVASVNLNTHRSFLVGNSQFLNGRFHVAHQCLSRYEFRIDHRRPEPLAQQSESNVRHVLHRCQENRSFA